MPQSFARTIAARRAPVGASDVLMFQPVVPIGGLSGWAFLNATRENQVAAFERSSEIVRDTDYFEARIGEIKSAEDLVADRRLLRVTLGAFGLQEDIDNRFFIRKILEDGIDQPDALANRLADERYKQLSEAFGFGSVLPPRTLLSGFGSEITDRFRANAFEVAVGDQDQNLRLALNAERELEEIALDDAGEDARWFQIMGNPPLRQIFETALNLPDSFAQIDIDKQLEVFKEKANRTLGIESLSDLGNEALRAEVIETFLLRDQIRSVNIPSPQAIALTLLQSLVTNG